MLIRGRNALGYAPYPEDVVTAFVAEARAAGMDVFRVFDALNSVEKTRPVIDAVREHAGYAEGAICYTGDVLDPAETTYTLDYYLRVAEQYVDAGAHGLVIKDMAGLLRPPAATALVSALRARFDVPVRLHTHDTAGGQLATYLAAIDAGRRRGRLRLRAARLRRQPAQPRRPARRPGPRRPRPRRRRRARPGRRGRPRALLERRARPLRPLRGRAARARHERLPP